MGNKKLAILVGLLLVTSVVSCTKANESPLTTSKSRAYPNSTVKVQASFPVPVKGILLGTKDILKESKISPDESGNWEDTLTLSGITPGKNKVVVVGKPSDGSKSIVYENALEVLPYPKLSFEYDRNNVKTSQTVKVTSDSNLTDVSFVLPDGAKQPFKKVDSHIFSFDTILPETDFSITVADEIDVLETHKEHSLEFLAQKNFYLKTIGPNKSTDILLSNVKDTNICNILYSIQDVGIKDDYMINLYEYEEKRNVTKNYGFGLLGLSPNKRYYVGFSTDEVYFVKPYSEDSYSLSSVLAYYYLLYDSENDKMHHFGTRYIKKFDNPPPGKTIKEAGSQYFIVGWKDNLMLMVERTPENKFYNPYTSDAKVRNMDEFNPVVPWSKARGVALNLDTFELKDTDLVKPYRPWVCFADQALGIVGYTGPYDVGNQNYVSPKGKKFRYNLEGLDYSLFVTDLQGKKVHNIFESTKGVRIDSSYDLVDTTLIGGCIYKTKQCAILLLTAIEKVPTGEWQDGGMEGGSSRKRLSKYYVAVLEMDSGNATLLSDITNLYEKYRFHQIICSDPDSPPTIALGGGILAQFNGEKFEIVSKPIPRQFVYNYGLIIR